MERRNISSGTRGELVTDFSRAGRVEDSVYVSRTTDSDKKGDIVGIDDHNKQTIQTIQNIERVLQKASASLKNAFLTNADLYA